MLPAAADGRAAPGRLAATVAPTVITAKGVSKRFGAKRAIDGLSLSVAEGEVVGLLGPNGSGKTTMVRMFNGLLRPDAGGVTVGGLDPLERGDDVRRATGVLTETARFYRHMTALQNLRFFADLYGVTDPERPRRLLEEVGLGDDMHRQVGTYSTGMRKRLGFAKALLHDPRVLFLDEPTSGLDPDGTRDVLTEIRRLNEARGTTILVCSHLLPQLETVCHRYLFIDSGRLIEQGTLAELKARYQRTVLLEVDTDLAPEGTAFHGHAFTVTEREGRRLLTFRLEERAQVPGLLRSIVGTADVYGARVVEQGLEELYFAIRQERLS